MRKYIRQYNYIQDYFYTVYEHYIKFYPAYPCEYYNLDLDNSVYDKSLLYAGSYEKFGVGEFSGIKWSKISQLPLFNVQTIQPTQGSDEKGVSYADSLSATASIPSIYGLEPKPWDVIDLNFGFKAESNKIKPLFVVSKVDLAHHGEYLKLYQLSLQVAPFNKTEIELQISDFWSFYEPTKEILPLSNVQILYDILQQGENLTKELNTLMNEKTGIYME